MHLLLENLAIRYEEFGSESLDFSHCNIIVSQVLFQFASTLLETASKNIESTLSEMQQERQGDQLVKVAAKSLSNLASRSAEAIKDEASDNERK